MAVMQDAKQEKEDCALTDYDLGIGEKRYGKTTKEERLKVYSFVLEKIPGILDEMEPFQIARFLRARQFKKWGTVKMIKAYLEIVKQMSTDDLQKNWIEEAKPVSSSGCTRIGGFDNEGRLILIKQMKYQYMPKQEDGTPGEFSEEWSVEAEKALMMHIALEFKDPLEIFFKPKDMMLTVDFEGYRLFAQSNRKMTGDLMKFCQEYLPELMGQAWLVNGFKGIKVLSNFAKTFVDEETAKKWIVFDEASDLLEKVPSEMLEERYGGKHSEFLAIDDSQCDFKWLMQDLYEKTNDEKVKQVLALLEGQKNENKYYDVKKLRKLAREQGLYHMEFPKLLSKESMDQLEE